MKLFTATYIFYFSLLLFLNSCVFGQSEEEVSELKFIKILNTENQTSAPEGERFDLSGIVEAQNSVWVIADKPWNNNIYKSTISDHNISFSDGISFFVDFKIDIEGIDFCDSSFFVINEANNMVYEIKSNNDTAKLILIDWNLTNYPANSDPNAGLEGIAIDNENKVIYLAKERDPSMLFKLNLKDRNIEQVFGNLINNEESISDMKYENGFLYLLERESSTILRINTQTQEILRVSIKNTLNPNGLQLYTSENPEYGIAEALLLKENEIWIGLDNNGTQTNSEGINLGIKKTTNPAIIIFERPEWF